MYYIALCACYYTCVCDCIPDQTCESISANTPSKLKEYRQLCIYMIYDYAVLLLISILINYIIIYMHQSMQTVLEQGSIDKPLPFDVGLIQLSFIPVCSLNTCNISVKLCRGFALQCFSLNQYQSLIFP